MSLTTRPTMESWIDIGSAEPGEDGFALEDPVPKDQRHADEERDDEVADEHLLHGERCLAAEEPRDGDRDDGDDDEAADLLRGPRVAHSRADDDAKQDA